MQQAEEADDLADFSTPRGREDDSCMRMPFAMESEKIRILSENHATFRSGIFQLLKIIYPDQIRICRGRDINPSMSQGSSDPMIDVVVKMKTFSSR